MHGICTKYGEIIAAATAPLTTSKTLEQKLSFLPPRYQDTGQIGAFRVSARSVDAHSTLEPGGVQLCPGSPLLPRLMCHHQESYGFVPKLVYASYTCIFNFMIQLNYYTK